MSTKIQSSAKHTPGNFGVIKNLFGNGGIFIVSDQVDDAIIAHMGGDVPDVEGNALLFAAAPDMLAALKAYGGVFAFPKNDFDREVCYDNCRQPGSPYNQHTERCKATQAAIAKAEGGQ